MPAQHLVGLVQQPFGFRDLVSQPRPTLVNSESLLLAALGPASSCRASSELTRTP
jgi:hypothetical protein